METRASGFVAATIGILAAMLFAPPTAARGAGKAQPGPLDSASYAAELARCVAQISALRQHPAEITQFRQSLPSAWRVRTGGHDFEISTAWLDAALAEVESHPDAAPRTWEEILARLNYMREQATALAVGPAPPLAVARPKLDAIFRGAEFRGLAGPTPLQRWWRRVTLWIGERIDRLLAGLHLGAHTGDLVAYGLVGIAVLLLAFVLWRTLAGRARQMELQIDRPAPFVDWRVWIREAFDAADRGDYREAIHAAYWGAVARLEDLGVLPGDRSRTPREFVRLLDSASERKAPFRDLATRFELAWYGHRAPSFADWESAKSQLEKMGCLGVSTAGTVSS